MGPPLIVSTGHANSITQVSIVAMLHPGNRSVDQDGFIPWLRGTI